MYLYNSYISTHEHKIPLSDKYLYISAFIQKEEFLQYLYLICVISHHFLVLHNYLNDISQLPPDTTHYNVDRILHIPSCYLLPLSLFADLHSIHNHLIDLGQVHFHSLRHIHQIYKFQYLYILK